MFAWGNIIFLLIISWRCSQVLGSLLAGLYHRWPHTCTSCGWLLSLEPLEHPAALTHSTLS